MSMSPGYARLVDAARQRVREIEANAPVALTEPESF
jgi:hypothetical protein